MVDVGWQRERPARTVRVAPHNRGLRVGLHFERHSLQIDSNYVSPGIEAESTWEGCLPVFSAALPAIRSGFEDGVEHAP